MPIPSTAALSPSPQLVASQQPGNLAGQAQSQPWKMNQLLLGQMVRLTSGETALRINGQLYTPISPMPLSPGESRQLRVTSLEPVIKLTTVEGSDVKELSLQPLRAAATSMQSSLWAAMVSSGPYKLATLLSVFRSPPRIMQQNLSPQVQANLSAIATLLPNTDDLRSATRLKQALANVSLNGRELVQGAGRSPASELGRLLQSLHQQLSKQTQEQPDMARSSWPVDSYKGEQAMRSSVSLTLLNLLDEAMSLLAARGQRQGSYTSLPLQQWSWEFPLLSRDQGRLFSLTAWLRQRQQSRTGIRSSIWSLRCACELANHGFLAIVLRLKDRDARLHLQSESEVRRKKLQKLEADLINELGEHDIALKRFSCSAASTYSGDGQREQAAPALATTDFDNTACLSESLQERMRHAAVTGMLPVLEDFSLGNGTTDQGQAQMPDRVYQALACLFAVLVKAED